MPSYAPGWPKTSESLMLLDELPFDRYLRLRVVREGAPPEAVMHHKDEHGQRWRAVFVPRMGWRKVPI